MIKKYYWAIAVAAAFVAGTMTTGGVVYASFDQCSNDPPQGISDGRPFLEIWQAICDLETQVDSNEDSAILGFYTIRDDVSLSDFTAPTRISHRVLCDEGDVATGGGFRANDGADFNGNVQVTDSRPLGTFAGENDSGWNTQLTLLNDVSDTYFVFVVCADFDPPHDNAD